MAKGCSVTDELPKEKRNGGAGGGPEDAEHTKEASRV